ACRRELIHPELPVPAGRRRAPSRRSCSFARPSQTPHSILGGDFEMAQRALAALPYLLGLVVAAYLWHLAGTISYPARPGQLGPDFWPRVAIAIIAMVCIYEIGRACILGTAGRSVQGIAEHFEGEEDEEELGAPAEGKARTRIFMLVGGLALTLAYAV